jgi:hypothetical protein
VPCVPLFCWLVANGDDVPKVDVAGVAALPNPVFALAPPPNSPPPVLAPKAGLAAAPKPVLVEPNPPAAVPEFPNPPKAELLVVVAAAPPPNKPPLVVVEPNAGLFWPNGDEVALLAVEPNPMKRVSY